MSEWMLSRNVQLELQQVVLKAKLETLSRYCQDVEDRVLRDDVGKIEEIKDTVQRMQTVRQQLENSAMSLNP
jgi:hypothetical protein